MKIYILVSWLVIVHGSGNVARRAREIDQKELRDREARYLNNSSASYQNRSPHATMTWSGYGPRTYQPQQQTFRLPDHRPMSRTGDQMRGQPQASRAPPMRQAPVYRVVPQAPEPPPERKSFAPPHRYQAPPPPPLQNVRRIQNPYGDSPEYYGRGAYPSGRPTVLNTPIFDKVVETGEPPIQLHRTKPNEEGKFGSYSDAFFVTEVWKPRNLFREIKGPEGFEESEELTESEELADLEELSGQEEDQADPTELEELGELENSAELEELEELEDLAELEEEPEEPEDQETVKVEKQPPKSGFLGSVWNYITYTGDHDDDDDDDDYRIF